MMRVTDDEQERLYVESCRGSVTQEEQESVNDTTRAQIAELARIHGQLDYIVLNPRSADKKAVVQEPELAASGVPCNFSCSFAVAEMTDTDRAEAERLVMEYRQAYPMSKIKVAVDALFSCVARFPHVVAVWC